MRHGRPMAREKPGVVRVFDDIRQTARKIDDGAQCAMCAISILVAQAVAHLWLTGHRRTQSLWPPLPGLLAVNLNRAIGPGTSLDRALGTTTLGTKMCAQGLQHLPGSMLREAGTIGLGQLGKGKDALVGLETMGAPRCDSESVEHPADINVRADGRHHLELSRHADVRKSNPDCSVIHGVGMAPRGSMW